MSSATRATRPRRSGPRARLADTQGPLVVAGLAGVGALALQLRDPHVDGSWGLCPFRAMTGWSCPFCGGLRAVNDLGQGQLADAAHSNLLFVASIPLVVGLWALWLRAGWTGSRRVLPSGVVRAMLLTAVVLGVVFTVYRNTPWGSAWRAA